MRVKSLSDFVSFLLSRIAFAFVDRHIALPEKPHFKKHACLYILLGFLLPPFCFICYNFVSVGVFDEVWEGSTTIFMTHGILQKGAL